MKFFEVEKNRAIVYRIVLAVLPLLAAYGLLSDGQVAQWGLVAAAILGMSADGLAVANTSRLDMEDEA